MKLSQTIKQKSDRPLFEYIHNLIPTVYPPPIFLFLKVKKEHIILSK